jgi:hypothetical protein
LPEPSLGDWMTILRSRIFPLVLCLLPLFSIWYFDYLPLQDYPNHFAKFNIISDYEQSAFYRDNFIINVFDDKMSFTYLLLDIFVAKLLSFLDIDVAMKAFITLYIILYAVSIYLLTKHTGRDFNTLMLLHLPLIYSSYFHLGFLNFIFSIPVLLLLMHTAENFETERKKSDVIMMIFLLIVMYLTHVFTFFIFFVFLLCKITSNKFSIKNYLLVIAALLILFVFGKDFLVGLFSHKFTGEAFFDKIIFLTFPFTHLPGNVVVVVTIFFIFAVLIIVRNSTVNNKAYLIASLVLFIIYFALPFKRILAYVDVRAFFFSLVIFPLSLQIKDNRHVSLAKLLLLSVFIINLSWLFVSCLDMNKNFSTACKDQIRDGSKVLPIDASKSRSAVIRPSFNSWGYFFKDKELLTPYLFTGKHVRFEYTQKPPAPSPWWVILGNEAKVRDNVNLLRDTYDYIILVGMNPHVEEIVTSISNEVCSDKSVRLYEIEKNAPLRLK